jgi:3-oxoacyl-[acyl-carrier-protein] synthase II
VKEVWITGLGLVSPLGEGRAAHLAALACAALPPVDAAAFAPFLIHPATALTLDRQIPKKGDQRQMEAWQRLGTYAAGLALDDAGARPLVAEMDLFVAAGGGERDLALDEAVLAELGPMPAAAAAVRLNELLAGGLRPTLFLAQLANLLAGNISIVHGVTGASRTLMGEEVAGAEALRVASLRLAEGRSGAALVGGAFSAPRWDTFMAYASVGLLRRDAPFAPVFSRDDAPGAVLASLGAFLVIETADAARARGQRGLARVAGVATGMAQPGAAAADHLALLARLPLGPGPLPIVSAASGAAGPMAAERAFLAHLDRVAPLRAAGSRLGWGVEASFPASAALAALMLAEGRLPAPLEAAEAPFDEPVGQILVSGFGAWRGEALALLARIPAEDQP